MARILAVDDEDDVLITIGGVLEANNHIVLMAASGHQALELLEQEPIDLVVLDIIMPEIDGIQVCRRIRADPYLYKLPVIFLTAKDDPHDIALGLDAGADDYLVKPFDLVELPARIRALLRRGPGGTLDAEAEYLVVGCLQVHSSRSEAQVGETLVELTPTEHRILHYLVRHAGQPMAVEQLLEDIWEYPPGVGDPKLVHVHVGKLRRKLGLAPEAPEYIRNVHGRGYLIGN